VEPRSNAGLFLMLAATANFVAGHRISVSRAFGVMFFITVLVCDSAHEATIVAPVLFLSGLVLIGIATVGRLWCSLYISGYKNSQLVTAGPYSMCRNPLYLFSFLGFVGIGLATETASIPLALIVAVLLVYPHVIKREEAHLRSKFGEAFTRYAARTPRILPDLSKYNEPDSYTVNPKLFRRTAMDVVWFVWFVGIVELVEALHEYQFFQPIFSIP
jgi:protein-S-isoprenylcysteine O-methyltransferase Ste14